MRTMYVLCKNCGAKIWVERPPKKVFQLAPPIGLVIKAGETATFKVASIRYECRRCGQAAQYHAGNHYNWWQVGHYSA
jgi:DNA-directed RNA polymerase subunit RPC12/RpoP